VSSPRRFPNPSALRGGLRTARPTCCRVAPTQEQNPRFIAHNRLTTGLKVEPRILIGSQKPIPEDGKGIFRDGTAQPLKLSWIVFRASLPAFITKPTSELKLIICMPRPTQRTAMLTSLT